jgi:hypothetical protein
MQLRRTTNENDHFFLEGEVVDAKTQRSYDDVWPVKFESKGNYGVAVIWR